MRFPKARKLRHRSLVEGLFREGKSLYDFPLRMVYRVMTREELKDNFCDYPPQGIAPVQMMVTVPKKKRRHAVDRVLMRRRIREAYRLVSPGILTVNQSNSGLQETMSLPKGDYLQLAFIYLHNENLPYDTIQHKMQKLLAKLVNKLKAKNRQKSERSHAEDTDQEN